MKTRIEIDTKTFVRFWLVVIGFALVALAIYSARTALIIIGSALFLAIALSKPVNLLTKILPGKSRVLSTALAYVVVIGLLGVIVFLVIPPIISQMTKFAETVPDLVNSATRQYAGASDFISKYNLQPQVDKLVTSFKDGMTGVGSSLVSGVGSLLATITASILVLVLAFLMLVEGPTWLSKLWAAYDDREQMAAHRKLLGRMYNVVTGYVVGQLSVSAIAGTVAGVAVFTLGMIFSSIPVDLAIPSAMIVFVASLVPLFGAMIGATLVSLILALNSVSVAVIFLVFFILYQQVEANYISPTIQSKRIDLSALIILIAVTVGVYLFGIAGGIISIPIAGCIKVIAEDYIARSHKHRAIAE
ncbi:MAG: AI-2E family transporter [Candidatus Saccharibacteria bacterium]